MSGSNARPACALTSGDPDVRYQLPITKSLELEASLLGLLLSADFVDDGLATLCDDDSAS